MKATHDKASVLFGRVRAWHASMETLTVLRSEVVSKFKSHARKLDHETQMLLYDFFILFYLVTTLIRPLYRSSLENAPLAIHEGKHQLPTAAELELETSKLANDATHIGQLFSEDFEGFLELCKKDVVCRFESEIHYFAEQQPGLVLPKGRFTSVQKVIKCKLSEFMDRSFGSGVGSDCMRT